MPLFGNERRSAVVSSYMHHASACGEARSTVHSPAGVHSMFIPNHSMSKGCFIGVTTRLLLEQLQVAPETRSDNAVYA
jgi:hypothetical protein